MYLWKVDSLVDDFKSGQVSQREELKYMLLFTIVMALASDPLAHIGSSYNFYDAIDSVLIIGISILGIYSCYKINKNGDNREFIVRMMCIGLPVMIRTLVVFVPVFFIGGILEMAFLDSAPDDDEFYETTAVQAAMLPAYVAAYYWYLSMKIRAVSA